MTVAGRHFLLHFDEKKTHPFSCVFGEKGTLDVGTPAVPYNREYPLRGSSALFCGRRRSAKTNPGQFWGRNTRLVLRMLGVHSKYWGCLDLPSYGTLHCSYEPV